MGKKIGLAIQFFSLDEGQKPATLKEILAMYRAGFTFKCALCGEPLEFIRWEKKRNIVHAGGFVVSLRENRIYHTKCFTFIRQVEADLIKKILKDKEVT